MASVARRVRELSLFGFVYAHAMEAGLALREQMQAPPVLSSSPLQGDPPSVVSIAVGTVCGVAAVAVAIIIIALISFCVYKRMKRRPDDYVNVRTSEQTENEGDSVYEPVSATALISGSGYESVPGIQPLRLPAGFQNPTYGAVRVDGSFHGNMAKSSSTAESSEHFLNNPMYGNVHFDSKSGPSATVEESSKYEYGMYVPTEDERKAIEASQLLESTEEPLYMSIHADRPRRVQDFFQEETRFWEPASSATELYSQLSTHRYREIPRGHIRVTNNLGSGQFGTVDKGVWLAPWGPIDVAVKMMNESSTEEDRVKFLQEAAIMGQFFHPNIVRLHGVVTMGEPAMIVEEYMSRGDLREYLNSLPKQSLVADMNRLCLKFCSEIASGAAYFSGKSFVHRDLAARNVLISKDKVCKIADFGMARDIEDTDYYTSHGGMVPVKWTAPEALQFKKYSTASDVWSFGVVMYEIWSLGHKPFEGYSNPQTFRMVMDGYRLPPPPGCPRAIYQLMVHCWHPESHSRPSFPGVTAYLSQSESSLLSWSETDAASNPNATVLGAELEDGHNTFLDLQNTYKE